MIQPLIILIFIIHKNEKRKCDDDGAHAGGAKKNEVFSFPSFIYLYHLDYQWYDNICTFNLNFDKFPVFEGSSERKMMKKKDIKMKFLI